MELNTSLVNNPSCEAIESVDFADNRALSNATKAWVARTSSKIIHLGGYQRSPRARSRCGGTCFGASMSAPNYDDIEWPTINRAVLVML